MDTSSKLKVMIIGGSAGSLAMVLKIVPLLTASMNASIVIVFHRKQSEDNVLVDVLGKRTSYTVKEAEDKDLLTPQTIFVAPADYHLLIEKDGTITLDDSEKINYSRPSIDVTFESAAEAFPETLTCLLLSGANADGAAGLLAVKKAGAKIAVQDPTFAEVPFMPKAALDHVHADFIINDRNLKDFLNNFLRQ